MGAKDYAILVGISRYPGLSPLQGPERDVADFAAWLEDPQGGAVPHENIQRIVTHDFPPQPGERPDEARPGREQFQRALRRLLEPDGTLRERVGRRLYLYFSGHGYSASSSREAALYTAAANRTWPEHIPGTRYFQLLWDAAIFDEIVLVMDCCRDQELLSVITDPEMILMKNPGRAKSVRHFSGYAVPYGLAAKERPIPPGGAYGGLFTHALLLAFRSALADGDGKVTGQAVKDYLVNHWTELVAGEAIEEPVIDLDSARDIVFRAVGEVSRSVAGGAPQAGPTTRVAILAPGLADGAATIEDRPGSVAAEVAIAAGRGEVDLPAGFYKLQFAGQARVFEVLGAAIEVRLHA